MLKRLQRNRFTVIGLSLFLAWNYLVFFSCGTAEHPTKVGTLEELWMFVGLFEALFSACALRFHRILHRFIERPITGVIAVVLGCVGTMLIWLGYKEGNLWMAYSPGIVCSAGAYVLMCLIWVNVLSQQNEEDIEFIVPAATTLSMIIYFAILIPRASVIVNCLIVMAGIALSMRLAFRDIPLSPGNGAGNYPELERVSKLRLGTVAMMVFALWFQVAYFRLLSIPVSVGDRFLHFIIPFSCAFIIAIGLFLVSLRRSYGIDFAFTYRWCLPLILISYPILFINAGDTYVKIIAYVFNFAAMYLMQFSLWVCVSKYIRYTKTCPYRLSSLFLHVEGLGIFFGMVVIHLLRKYFSVEQLLLPSLFILVVIASFVILIARPHWSFSHLMALEKTDEIVRDKEEDFNSGTGENLIDTLTEKACLLQKEYGLTERETEIAALLMAGRSRPYIRDRLGISLNTVHTHARNLMAKCGVSSQRDLIDLVARK